MAHRMQSKHSAGADTPAVASGAAVLPVRAAPPSAPRDEKGTANMQVKGGRLEFLVPHLLRGQLLRPGFVKLSLKLGFAQQMPAWARLQFTNAGVSQADLDRVLARITGLESWADEWESLGRAHEQAGRDALTLGRRADAAQHLVASSAAYNFAQYVIFMDTARKASLHASCVRAYASAAPLLDPPAERFEVMFRRKPMIGYLRVPPSDRPCPVVVLFHGTNAVKEELHWWSEALLQRGIATLVFDGPGMGQTFHRLSMVAEPRPVGRAILDAIESRLDLDAGAIAFFGQSLGGYMAIRMASGEPRVRAVATVSPPYSADIYWNVTLSSMRRELAALYGTSDKEMGSTIERITLANVLEDVKCPLLVSGGGRDLITPSSEAWSIFENARCPRELVFYPRGAHDCFNVLSDLRPRIVTWLAHQLEGHRSAAPFAAMRRAPGLDSGWSAAEAVDPDFADALSGEVQRVQWHTSVQPPSLPARWSWRWNPLERDHLEVVHRVADAAPVP